MPKKNRPEGVHFDSLEKTKLLLTFTGSTPSPVFFKYKKKKTETFFLLFFCFKNGRGEKIDRLVVDIKSLNLVLSLMLLAHYLACNGEDFFIFIKDHALSLLQDIFL